MRAVPDAALAQETRDLSPHGLLEVRCRAATKCLANSVDEELLAAIHDALVDAGS